MASFNGKPSENNKKARLAAGVLAMAVLFFMLFSVFFIAHEANHDCSGDDCPVCALIQMCEDNIRQLGSGATASAAAEVLVLLILATTVISSPVIKTSTPVSTKVRLNN